MVPILAIIAFLTIFVVLIVHLAYPRILKKSFSKHSENRQTFLFQASSELPSVTVLIPVYNEGSVIERRITNILETNYPLEKLQIIVVDSGSSDMTSAIVKDKFSNQVTLIQEPVRRGKAHAINLALKSCTGDIVILTDGPTLYSRDTIYNLIQPFADKQIGAVTAKYDIPSDSTMARLETNLWKRKEEIRILESKLYSTTWLSGEALAFRKELIASVDEDTIADDSNIALQIISKGYRAIISENASFVEKSPSELQDHMKIKARRSLGGIQETLRFRHILLNPKFGMFGKLIFPYHFFFHVISPVLFIAGLILAVIGIIEIQIYFGTIFVAILIGALLSASILLRNRLIAFVYTQFILVESLIKFVLGKNDVKWVQSRTTRSINA